MIGNLIYSGVLERFPTLQFVSVESGVGWIPFLLKALDYQVGEMTPGSMDNLSMAPSDYFRRQIHSCFWFERSGIAEAIESVGAEHLMFETDFPHPTCIYPDGLEYADAALEGVDDDTIAGIMGLNAARLYDIPLPGDVCLIDSVVARLAAAGCVAPEEEARELLRDAPDAAELEARLRAARSGGAAGVDHRARRRSAASCCTWRRVCTCRVCRPRSWRGARQRCCPRAVSPSISAPGAARWRRGCSTRCPTRSWSASTSIRARRGARRATVCARWSGDLAAPLHLVGGVDVVTAVAPYVPTAERRLLPSDVQRHEPVRALDGGDDGLAVVRRVVAHAATLLRVGGHLLLELGGAQDRAARARSRTSRLHARSSRGTTTTATSAACTRARVRDSSDTFGGRLACRVGPPTRLRSMRIWDRTLLRGLRSPHPARTRACVALERGTRRRDAARCGRPRPVLTDDSLLLATSARTQDGPHRRAAAGHPWPSRWWKSMSP